ncbi:hypothetical protein [Micromonospora sp. LOL_023]|uniref:hypothetical protein n=1 Tax=Micromonospora sp. LOL_023 TaxID=3345418 RepID=UPI003A8C4E24
MRQRSAIRRRVLASAGRTIAIAVWATVLSVPAASGWVASAAAAPAPSASAPQDDSGRESVRYYIVDELPGGEREFLFAIAARTLGDGRRYREIFELNVGRAQPDGGQLTDAAQLEPGWILVLPDDARGAGVRYGPLPDVGGSAAAPPVLSPTAPTRQADRSTELLLRGGAAMVAVGLFALAILVLRRGGGRSRPAEPPPVLPAVAVIRTAAAPPSGKVAPRRTPPPPEKATPRRTPPPAAPPTPRRTPPPPDKATPDKAAGQRRAIDTDDPATGDPRRLAHLEVELRVGEDPAVLRLTGQRQPRGAAPYGWHPPDGLSKPAGSHTLIPVGTGPDGQFWVELRQAPDVLTVTGPAEARQRAARLLTERLLAAGVTVTVVGDGITSLPSGCRRYAGDTAALVTDVTAQSTVILFAEPQPNQLAAVRALLERPERTTVPIVVAEGPSARWTLQVAGHGAP